MKRLPPNQQEALDPSTKPERLRELAKRGQALERKVAQNPNTPTDLLLALAKKSERKLNEGLAKNPSTPPKILFSLAGLFPREFLQNPVLPLLFVEDPAATRHLTDNDFANLLRCEEVPEYFFSMAYERCSSGPLRYVLAQNPRTPTAYLEALARTADKHELLALLENPSSSPRTIAILATQEKQFAHHQQQEVLRSGRLTREHRELLSSMGLLGKPATKKPSLEELHTLAALGNTAQYLVAADPSAPAELLETLSLDFPLVIEMLARNPNTPLSLLAKIANEHPDACWAVAKHPRLPGELLAQLASSNKDNTRLSVAENPNTPKETLAELLFDASPAISRAAFRNPNTPKEQLALFSQLTTLGSMTKGELELWVNHPKPMLRLLVAQQPNLSNEALLRLSQDQDTTVKSALLQNPVLLEHLEPLFREEAFSCFAASQKTARPMIFLHLATHPSVKARLLLAGNKRITADALAVLVNDQEEEVRRAAEKNEQHREVQLLLSHKPEK